MSVFKGIMLYMVVSGVIYGGVILSTHSQCGAPVAVENIRAVEVATAPAALAAAIVAHRSISTHPDGLCRVTRETNHDY